VELYIRVSCAGYDDTRSLQTAVWCNALSGLSIPSMMFNSERARPWYGWLVDMLMQNLGVQLYGLRPRDQTGRERDRGCSSTCRLLPAVDQASLVHISCIQTKEASLVTETKPLSYPLAVAPQGANEAPFPHASPRHRVRQRAAMSESRERVESSRVESSRVESSRVESSRDESSRVESRLESSRVHQIKPSNPSSQLIESIKSSHQSTSASCK